MRALQPAADAGIAAPPRAGRLRRRAVHRHRPLQLHRRYGRHAKRRAAARRHRRHSSASACATAMCSAASKATASPLLLSGVQLENLFPVADGFRELLHQCRYDAHGQTRYASASVGVAVISKDTPSSEYALEHARLACKTAKQRGRDQTEIYVGEFDARIAREIEAGWTDRLRNALEQERFVFLVQPIVPIAALPDRGERSCSARAGASTARRRRPGIPVRGADPHGRQGRPADLAERVRAAGRTRRHDAEDRSVDHQPPAAASGRA